MPGILDDIIRHKKEEVGALRARAPRFEGRPDERRPFSEVLRRESEMAVIAEVKKASPSKGVICADFEPVTIALRYEKAGAAAVSVLTDRRFFQGSIEYLIAVREAISLPVLRKEFIIDTVQIEESVSVGADALLLIAAALSDGQMGDLYAASLEYDIEPLVEIHNGRELDRAMKLSPKLLGINNRDLTTFKTDIRVTIDLAGHIPGDVTVVSESGISTGGQAARLKGAGVHAVLVGEALVVCPDPAPLIRELRYAG